MSPVTPPAPPEEAVGLDGTTPYEIVHREAPTSVRRYRSSADAKPPVAIVYAMFNRPTILDLVPDRSVVGTLRDAGHDVYLVDWGRPSLLDATLGLDDYVARYLANAMAAIEDDAGTEAHLLGYSTGGTLAALHAARSPRTIRSLGLLGAPLAFDGIRQGLYGLIGSSDLPEDVVDGNATVDGPLLAFAFSMAAPFEYHFGRYLQLAEEATAPAAFGARLRRFAWGADTIDVPSAVLGDLIEIFRSDAIMAETLEVAGAPIALAEIDRPTIALVGAKDRFVPPASTTRALEAMSAEETAILESPTGHVGLAAEAVSYETIWPGYLDWLAGR